MSNEKVVGYRDRGNIKNNTLQKRKTPDNFQIDKADQHIMSVKVGQKFIFTDGIKLSMLVTNSVDQVVELFDAGPKRNVQATTIFDVIEKTQQYMTVRYKEYEKHLNPETGRIELSTNIVKHRLIFNKNPHLIVDTVFTKDKKEQVNRAFGNLWDKPEKKTDDQKMMEKEFRKFSRL